MCKTQFKIIENENFEEERSLYMLSNSKIFSCTFSGPKDGESPLKDASNIEIKDSKFDLRYPLWRTKNVKVENTLFTDKSRAPFWYNKIFDIINSSIYSVKAFRECFDLNIQNLVINSSEAFWKCKKVKINNTELDSEYPFFECRNLKIENLKMDGKYSFQYSKNIVIKNSYLKTKDAFWHSKNVTVYDSVIEGEYLAWYSKNIKLVRCKIIGTQPFCETKNLILKDCTMENTDLAFELSVVKGSVLNEIESIKSPKKCNITSGGVKNLIIDRTLVNPKKTKISVKK